MPSAPTGPAGPEGGGIAGEGEDPPLNRILRNGAATTRTPHWLVLDGCALSSSGAVDIAALRKYLIHGRPAPDSGSTEAAAICTRLPRSGHLLVTANPNRTRVPGASLHRIAADLDTQLDAAAVAREARADIEGTLVRELVSTQHDTSRLEPWIASLGLVTNAPIKAIAALVHTNSESDAAHAALIGRALRDLGLLCGSQALVGALDDVVYALVPLRANGDGDSTDGFVELLETMIEIFTHRHGRAFPVGSSTVVLRTPDDLAQGLISARRLAQREFGAQPADASESPDLPVPMTAELLRSDPEHAETLYRALLQPIIDYDAAHRTDYLVTLRTFLSLDGGIRSTAEELGIHANTLRYRLSRIERLARRGVQRLPDRVDFYLALCLYEADGGRAQEIG